MTQTAFHTSTSLAAVHVGPHAFHSGDEIVHVTVRNQLMGAADLREAAAHLEKIADSIDGGVKKTPPKLGPQHEALMFHFLKKGSITVVEAEAMYKIRALPRRIADLKEHGWDIESVRKTDTAGQRYVRYVYKDGNLY